MNSTDATPHPDIVAQLDALKDRLLGLIPPTRIRAVHIERPAPEIIAGFQQLPDLTSTAADILDSLGYDGAIAASEIVPLRAGQRMVGPAVTVRHIAARVTPGFNIAQGRPAPQLGGRDQVTLCQRGDVMVIEAHGIRDASNFGGLMATAIQQADLAGLVVDGCVRDVENIRAMGLNVWARGITPRTGKHRIELVEFNGPVEIAAVQIRPGDLILGDSDGIVVVPLALAGDVLAKAAAATAQEAQLVAALQAGASPREAAAILPPSKW